MTVNSPTQMPKVGDVVGDRYVIQRLLARGGMGAVFVAQHNTTDAIVALKVLLESTSEDATTRARFVREAKVAATLGHPGIVKVFDAGVDPKAGPFLAMELLEGQSLDRVIELQNPSVEQRLGYVREMLEALTVAHQAGVVHRDIKPENLFLASDGEGGERVKLLDFGIARVQQATTQTVDGTALGTIYYMAPEQMMDAGRVTAAADIWSIGVMIYELFSDTLPFDGTTIHEVAVKVCTKTPTPLNTIAPTASQGLTDLVASCLSKDPKKRPKDAAALAAMFDGIGIFSNRTARTSLTPARPLLLSAIAPEAYDSPSKTIESSPGIVPSLVPPPLSLTPSLTSLNEPPRTTLTPSGAATVVAVRTDLNKKSWTLPVVAVAGLLALGAGGAIVRERLMVSRSDSRTVPAASTSGSQTNSALVQENGGRAANTPPVVLTPSTAVAAADSGVTLVTASPEPTGPATTNGITLNGIRNARVLRPATVASAAPQIAVAPVVTAVVTPIPTVVAPVVVAVAPATPTNSPSTQPVVRPTTPTVPVLQPRVQPVVQPHTEEPEAPVSF